VNNRITYSVSSSLYSDSLGENSIVIQLLLFKLFIGLFGIKNTVFYDTGHYQIYTILLGIAAVLETPASLTTREFPEAVPPG
jgi:hypothetical protein